MAPELLRFETCNTLESDVFSFGVTLYEVFARRDPYEGENAEEVLQLVADKKIRKRPPAPRHMPDPVKALMGDCLEEESDKRPTFNEIDTRLKRIDADSLDTVKTAKNSSVSVSHGGELHKPEELVLLDSVSVLTLFMYFPSAV